MDQVTVKILRFRNILWDFDFATPGFHGARIKQGGQ
jgi:hypothetical protein